MITYFDCEVEGRLALFSHPLSKNSGERKTYSVPTFESLKGLVENIYWKPTITIVIDQFRVMNEIQTESIAFTSLTHEDKESKHDLSRNLYLRDVKYQVRFHMDWNLLRSDLEQDRDFGKHREMMRKYIESGGKRIPYLGRRECRAFIGPCTFGEGKSFYDDKFVNVGYQFHHFLYPNNNNGKFQSVWCNYIMINSVILNDQKADIKNITNFSIKKQKQK